MDATPAPFAPLPEAPEPPSPGASSAIIMPAPLALPGVIWHPKHGTPATIWRYLDAAGALLFVVARFDVPGGKEVLPYSCTATGWMWKAPPAPRPLYGLDRLAARPDAPVVLVEGEKAADAAAELFPNHVAMTWQGGSNATAKADWSPLAGHCVVVWPDNDGPGRKAALAVAAAATAAGAASVATVTVPTTWPVKWDVADPLPEGVTADELSALLLCHDDLCHRGDDFGATLPEGFRMTPEGLMFFPAETERNPDPAPAWICAPFRVLGEADNGQGCAQGLALTWRDRRGRDHIWSVPKRLVHNNGNEIAAELENNGLTCGVDSRAHQLLKEAIASARSDRWLLAVDRSGWHMVAGTPAFVLPNGQAFGPNAASVIVQGDQAAGREGADFRAAGSLKDWQRDIGTLCIGNSRLILGVCAALDGPLLDLLNEQSGGVHVVGQSQSGKSTTAFVAGSVWGCGDRGRQVRMWRATSNGLEGAAATCSDTVLILDEMGQADARDVAGAVYMLANDAGKQRAGRTGAARAVATWRLSILSTGEVTLADKLAESGQRMTPGLAVRLLDVPADAGAGMGVFQQLHGSAEPGALADRLREAARTHFGTAGAAFVDRLASDRNDDPDTLRRCLGEIIETFSARFLLPGCDGQARTAVRRFARMAAAGELAIDYGILPWPPGEAARGLAECCQAWLDRRGGGGPREDRQALEQVSGFIEAHGASRFEPINNEGHTTEGQRIINRVGWRIKTERGTEYWVAPQAWKTEVCKGLDPARAAAVLHKAGKLVDWDKRHPAPRRQVPGEGRIRVYVLRDVLGSDDG